MSDTIEKLLNLMTLRKVNAAALTSILGFSSSAISEWKKGKAKPSADAIVKLAKYFNVTTDYLLGVSENPNTEASLSNNAQPQNAESLSERALRVARSWDELDETGKDEVLEAVGIARERMRSRMAGSRLQEG